MSRLAGRRRWNDSYRYQLVTPVVICRRFFALKFEPYSLGPHFLDPTTIRKPAKFTICGMRVPDPTEWGARVTRVDDQPARKKVAQRFGFCAECKTVARLIVVDAFRIINELSPEERIGPVGDEVGAATLFDRAFCRSLRMLSFVDQIAV